MINDLKKYGRKILTLNWKYSIFGFVELKIANGARDFNQFVEILFIGNVNEFQTSYLMHQEFYWEADGFLYFVRQIHVLLVSSKSLNHHSLILIWIAKQTLRTDGKRPQNFSGESIRNWEMCSIKYK